MRRTILFSLICLVLSACDMPAVRETQPMPSLTTETSVAPSRAAPTSTKLTPLRAPATSASSTPGASTTSQLSLDPSSSFGALESEGRLPIVYKELVSIDQVAFTADRKAMYFELHWSFLRYPVGPGDVTTWPPFTDCRLRLAPEEGTTITYFQVGKADSLLEPPDMTAWAGDLAVPIVKKKFPKLGKVLEIASTLVGLYDVFKPLFKAPEAYTAIDATMPAAGYFTQLVYVVQLRSDQERGKWVVNIDASAMHMLGPDVQNERIVQQDVLAFDAGTPEYELSIDSQTPGPPDEDGLPTSYGKLVTVEDLAFSHDRRVSYFEAHLSFLQYAVGPDDIETWPPFTDWEMKITPAPGSTIRYFQVAYEEDQWSDVRAVIKLFSLGVAHVTQIPSVFLEVLLTFAGDVTVSLHQMVRDLLEAGSPISGVVLQGDSAGYFTELVFVVQLTSEEEATDWSLVVDASAVHMQGPAQPHERIGQSDRLTLSRPTQGDHLVKVIGAALSAGDFETLRAHAGESVCRGLYPNCHTEEPIDGFVAHLSEMWRPQKVSAESGCAATDQSFVLIHSRGWLADPDNGWLDGCIGAAEQSCKGMEPGLTEVLLQFAADSGEVSLWGYAELPAWWQARGFAGEIIDWAIGACQPH